MSTIRSRRLSRGDSLDTLALGNLGHLIFTRHALQTAVPARYLVEHERVLVHVLALAEAVSWRDGEVVTLQVTAFDPEQRHGWTVRVTGRVHGTPELCGEGQRPTAPWIAAGGGDLLAIATEFVEGERLGVLDDDVPDAGDADPR